MMIKYSYDFRFVLLKRFHWILILTFFSFNSYAQEKDFGVWYNVALQYDIKKFQVGLSEEFRTVNNASELDQYFTDAGVSYKISKYFKIGGYYRFIKKKESDNSMYNRNRFYGDLTLRLPLKNLELSYRFRYQHQNNEFSEYAYNPSVVYNRHKLELSYNIPHSKLTPSLSYERFFRLNYIHTYFAENVRWDIGMEYKFNKRNRISVDYLLNKDLYPKVKYLNVLALGYKYDFK